MKKLLITMLMLNIVLLSACSAPDSSEKNEPSAIDIPDTTQTVSPSQTEKETTLEGENSADIFPEETCTITSVSDRDKKSQENSAPQDARKENSGKTKPQETLPVQSAGDDKSSEITKPADNTETQPPAKQTEPTEPHAGKSDTAAVAQRVLEYINQYRSSPATRLPGLTEYAQYRSRQLVSNFAHDTGDQRAAATALQYGEYVDPSVFGGSGQPYYRANAREAIAQAGYVGTIDEVALKLASLVKNSQNHWRYIGDSQYSYIAVGVTYESDMWYCTIAVASENTDEY